MMEKIGILGGTFDPVHSVHLKMAEAAYRALELDQVILMPSGTPSYKLEKHTVTDKEDRLAMLRLAAEDCPWMTVSDMEIRRSGSTYTADTLKVLKENDPGNRFYFIVGTDAFRIMEKWHKAGEIFAGAVIAVIGRGTATEAETERIAVHYRADYHAEIVTVPFERTDISSSEVRDAFRRHEDLSGIVPEKVIGYIRSHHLYEGNL